MIAPAARSRWGFYLAVMLLAGCSGLPGGSSTAPAAAPYALRGVIASWMASGVKSNDLLYVTNSTDVDVYSYPQGELKGQLAGFSDPLGQCTDVKGDVYITDYTANTIVEYAHGGTKPLRTLSAPGTAPFSCAVDPESGDLAVTTAGNASGAGAGLAIYPKSKSLPKTYTYPAILNYAYCAYDDAGDLYVDGTPAHGYGYDFELAILMRKAKALKAVTVSDGVSWYGPLQWDRHYLAIGQPVDPLIERYTVSDDYGQYAGSTELTGAYDATQFVIAGRKAIVTNLYYYDRYITRWDVLVFDYPKGGSPTQEILESSTPVSSVALSRAQQ